jgi:uncharacterized protein YqeY
MLSEAELRRDLQAAMKARDALTVSVLRGVLAVVANQKIERGGADLAATDILVVLQREAKKREEAEEFARRAGRADLLEQNAAERAVLARYQPRQLDEAELANLVRSWTAEGTTTMGALMARLKDGYAGQYDGKRASAIVREILAGS